MYFTISVAAFGLVNLDFNLYFNHYTIDLKFNKSLKPIQFVCTVVLYQVNKLLMLCVFFLHSPSCFFILNQYFCLRALAFVRIFFTKSSMDM